MEKKQMEGKPAKPKREGNHYIPPPARQKGTTIYEASRFRERPVKIVENREEKLCNDSSLLFKDSDNNVKEKAKRNRRVKRSSKKMMILDNSTILPESDESLPKSSAITDDFDETISSSSELCHDSCIALDENPPIESVLLPAVEGSEFNSVDPLNDDLSDTAIELGTVTESVHTETVDNVPDLGLNDSEQPFPENAIPHTKVEDAEDLKLGVVCDKSEVLDNVDDEHTNEMRIVNPMVNQKLYQREPQRFSQSITSADSCVYEADWDSLYDDRGECILPHVISPSVNENLCEISTGVENMKINQSEGKLDNDDPTHPATSIIEIFGFSEDLKTNDILAAFSNYIQRGFNLKWVDNTHALGIFPSPAIAEEVLSSNIPLVKTRPISQGTALSQEKARTLVLPSSLRPKTCSALARRLVSGALGLRVNVTPEERAAERELLREAREKKICLAETHCIAEMALFVVTTYISADRCTGPVIALGATFMRMFGSLHNPHNDDDPKN